MVEFEDSDLINQKEVIKRILDGLSTPLKKISKECLKQAYVIDEIDDKITNSDNLQQIAKLSKISDEKKHVFVKLLGLRDRILLLIKRNEERLEFIDRKLKDSGVYDEKYNKDEIAKIEKAYSVIDEQDINLNAYESGGRKYKFFEGERWLFEGSKLDLSNDENSKIALSSDDKVLHKLISRFPESVSTIDAEMLLDIRFKQKILKEISSYIVEAGKKQKISEINKKLGGLLSFKTEIPESASSYIAGIQNLFAVMTKSYLLQKYPHSKNEISEKLKCNEKSELIPAGIREIALANGLAGEEIKDETQESEEIRLQSEKEEQETTNFNELLDFILGEENDIEEEKKEEQEILDEKKQIQQSHEELKKKNDEKEREAERLKEEAQLVSSLKKGND